MVGWIGVGEADWAFKTTFDVTKNQLAEQHADLLFEGLDTFCDISLVSLHSLLSPSDVHRGEMDIRVDDWVLTTND